VKVEEAITEVESGNVRFSRLLTICTTFFGTPRSKGSHNIFSMPWPGDPRVNIQEDKPGKASPTNAVRLRLR